MLSASLINQLVALGVAGDFRGVEALPGAGDHAQVLRLAASLRGDGLKVVKAMTDREREAFVKALAVYENTVSGLGSATALHQVLPLVEDDDHTLLDWVLSQTRSYWYYSHGAKSFAELAAMNAAHAAHRAENELREAERARAARAKRAEQATQRLFNAIRRGDLRAVQALLRHGAAAETVTPLGVPLVEFAESLGHGAIAEALRRAQGRASEI